VALRSARPASEEVVFDPNAASAKGTYRDRLLRSFGRPPSSSLV